MFKILKSKKGVTLVELLAVIIIMGIIAAIAVPTIGNLIERQRQNAAEATWTSIEEAARLYAVDLNENDTFSVQDLVTENYLSEAVTVLGGDTAPADPQEDVTADDIFVVGATNQVTVDLSGITGPNLFINGYLVYQP